MALTRKGNVVMLVLLLSFVLFAVPAATYAVHTDVAFSAAGGEIAIDFCAEGGEACESSRVVEVLALLGLPPFSLPVDLETGNKIFLANFTGGLDRDFETSNPGFFAGVGQLPVGASVNYRAVGTLQYWDPDAKVWTEGVPDDPSARVVLFGGLKIVQNCDLIICFDDFVEGNTVFTRNGVTGDASLFVGSIDSASDDIHTHLDWCLENDAIDAGPTEDCTKNNQNFTPGSPPAGAPRAGAYMVEMQMIETAGSGLGDSETFYVMFEQGLSDAQFGEALGSRILAADGPEAPTERVPLPLAALGVLIIALGRIGRHRRRNPLI